MTKGHSNQFQNDLDHYRMPNTLKKSKNPKYRVGYEATTGNNTSSGKQPNK